jgi:predicted PurR-regulated permease PerM
MDLTLFIVLIVISFILYYLTQSIQSLINELKEVKTKCIKPSVNNKEDFYINTDNPSKIMMEKAGKYLNNFNSIFKS